MINTEPSLHTYYDKELNAFGRKKQPRICIPRMRCEGMQGADGAEVNDQFLRRQGKKKSPETIRTKQKLRWRLFFPSVLMSLAFNSIYRYRQSSPLTHNDTQRFPDVLRNPEF